MWHRWRRCDLGVTMLSYDADSGGSKPGPVLHFFILRVLEFYYFRNFDQRPVFSRIFDTLIDFLIRLSISTQKPVRAVEGTHREQRVPM